MMPFFIAWACCGFIIWLNKLDKPVLRYLGLFPIFFIALPIAVIAGPIPWFGKFFEEN